MTLSSGSGRSVRRGGRSVGAGKREWRWRVGPGAQRLRRGRGVCGSSRACGLASRAVGSCAWRRRVGRVLGPPEKEGQADGPRGKVWAGFSGFLLFYFYSLSLNSKTI
jgi:hypothetical protein